MLFHFAACLREVLRHYAMSRAIMLVAFYAAAFHYGALRL